ncbi:3'-5' exonuclease [Panacagrimonas sp.]|uniref:3'-5' exonuclease n=1 Tax=Panacagrimonas sp. TaxID=2480088 RepID=UPI003B516E7E
MTATTLVFDIETVPDLDGARRVLGIASSDDDAVWNAMQSLRRAEKGTEFQPAHLQRIVAISCVLRAADSLKCWSIGDPTSDEAELIQKFFSGVERYKPILVSWNGGGFDLPVLHYRGLIHGVRAQAYWDTGHFDRESKWNNYLKRYEFRHTDLMDVLALYTGRQNAPLNEIAVLLGLPGKLGMDGSKVFDAYRAGRLDDIRAYCETDVMNTWLVYLRFQFMRGHLSEDEYEQEILLAREFLEASTAPHWADFAAAWSE